MMLSAPSRLHFGLLSFARPDERQDARQFGGAGLMLDQPGLRLRITNANEFSAAGPLAERVREVAARYARLSKQPGPPTCRIEVLIAPPEHVGLGTGTQISLAVIAGLHALSGKPPLDAVALARLSGRAARSAVGTHGFLHGGMILDAGKLARESVAPLERCVRPPADWRFVLVVPRAARGLSGDAERQAFASLPPIARETTDMLRGELTERLFPAAQRGDFATFSDSLFRYGHAAGMCFAARQGGAFASARVAALVDTLQRLGVRGVGQSSWGPTVFAALPDADAAEQLRRQLREHLQPDEQTIVAQINRGGARIERGDVRQGDRS